jgi:hypothetical protein
MVQEGVSAFNIGSANPRIAFEAFDWIEIAGEGADTGAGTSLEKACDCLNSSIPSNNRIGAFGTKR